jgi:transcriptional regulator with XRE-family HTH domain
MITAAQLRQARAHLNLDQSRVCEDCSIDKATLSKIENEKSKGNAQTLATLQLYYEGHGLEFIDGQGVRKAPIGVREYRGTDGFREFYTDIYNTVKSEKQTDIWLYNGVSDLVLNALGKDFLDMHLERMLKLSERFTFRVVVKEGDDSFLGSSYCSYKWLPEELFSDKTIYIYGSKIAFLNFDNNDVLAVVIDQKDTADQMRHFFEKSWENEAFEP